MDTQPASNEDYKPKFMWHALYVDGSILSQFENGNENSSELINKKLLKSFVITTIDASQVIFTQFFKTGQKFIYRSRNALRPGQGQIERIHIIGVIENNIRHVTFIHESTLTINSGDFTEENHDTPWYYPVKILPIDEIIIGEV